MKRIIAIVLLALCCTALFACDTQQEPTTEYSGTKEEQICAYARDVITAEIEALIEPNYGVSLSSLSIESCLKQEETKSVQVEVEDEETGEKKTVTKQQHVRYYYVVTALVTYYSHSDNKTYTGNYYVQLFHNDKTGDITLEILLFGGFQ